MYKVALTLAENGEHKPMAYVEAKNIPGIVTGIRKTTGVRIKRHWLSLLFFHVAVPIRRIPIRRKGNSFILATLVPDFPNDNLITAIDPTKGVIDFRGDEPPNCHEVKTETDYSGYLSEMFTRVATCIPAFDASARVLSVDNDADNDCFPTNVYLYDGGELVSTTEVATPWEAIAAISKMLDSMLYTDKAATALFNGALKKHNKLVTIGDPKKALFFAPDSIPATPIVGAMTTATERALKEYGII